MSGILKLTGRRKRRRRSSNRGVGTQGGELLDRLVSICWKSVFVFPILGKHRAENLTFPAYAHLLRPTLLDITMAHCSVDAPAHVTGAEFPCGAVPSGFLRTLLDCPTGPILISAGCFEGDKQKGLALSMNGHLSPALLETLDRFCRDTQQLCHFFLGFAQPVSDRRKFLFVHATASL